MRTPRDDSQNATSPLRQFQTTMVLLRYYGVIATLTNTVCAAVATIAWESHNHPEQLPAQIIMIIMGVTGAVIAAPLIFARSVVHLVKEGELQQFLQTEFNERKGNRQNYLLVQQSAHEPWQRRHGRVLVAQTWALARAMVSVIFFALGIFAIVLTTFF